MSFVDLMANDVWSEADILRRTEAIVRSQFTDEQERILNRKITGVILGKYTLSESEVAELTNFQTIVFLAQQEGLNATTDMDLLLRTFPVEQAKIRLNKPVVEHIIHNEVVSNQAEIDKDVEERNIAQEIVNNAGEDVLDLISLRNPTDLILSELPNDN